MLVNLVETCHILMAKNLGKRLKDLNFTSFTFYKKKFYYLYQIYTFLLHFFVLYKPFTSTYYLVYIFISVFFSASYIFLYKIFKFKKYT